MNYSSEQKMSREMFQMFYPQYAKRVTHYPADMVSTVNVWFCRLRYREGHQVSDVTAFYENLDHVPTTHKHAVDAGRIIVQ